MKSSGPKLTLLTGQLGFGGAERQLYALATGLRDRGFSVKVATLNPQAGDYWEERLRDDGIEVLPIPRVNVLARARHIHRAIQDTDLVHSFHFFANGYLPIANRVPRKPSIGGLRFGSRSYVDVIPSRLWRRLCLRGADVLVCNSLAGAGMLRENFGRLPQVEVIYNGVHCHSEAEIVAMKADGLRRLQTSGEQVVVGFVGRLDENKNLSLLLRALARLHPRFPDFRLIVVGDGPQRDQLVEEADNLGLRSSVRFLGSQSDVEPLIAAFDVLCLPSRSEGMPNVLMEAGALGTPVVATNVGGVPEIVSDEETGLLIPPDDEAGLAGQLDRCLASPELRSRLGQAGRQRMQRFFSIPQMVDAYTRLYERLL